MTYYQILHFALTALVILGAIQDWREREVSNWISVPLFLIGIVSATLWTFSKELLERFRGGSLSHYGTISWRQI